MLLRPAADWALLTCNCCKSPSPRGAFAAILAADVVGYTRLMGADETGTLRRLTELRQQVLEPLIAEHHGRLVKLMGDGLLVEFASVVDALTCAVAWQIDVRGRAGGGSR